MRGPRRAIASALLAGVVSLGPAAAAAQEAPAPDPSDEREITAVCRDVNVANSFDSIGPGDPDAETDDERDCRVALYVTREMTTLIRDLFGG